jgi:catechol 2,3-dioxygenase-like lactoylglutathione lyase family enzyme
MPEFSFVLLYVKNPPASANFYAGLLGQPVIESSDTFAMLPLRNGCMLGLWSRETVAPAPAALPGAGEIAFTVANAQEVEAEHQKWAARGLVIAQQPTRMDFGHTFVALDHDGNRLRVFAPEAA